MKFSFEKYKIVQQIKLDEGRAIFIYSSFPDFGEKYPELAGNNAFIFEENNDFLQIFRSSDRGFKIQNSDFVHVFEKDDKHYIQDYQGFIYELDTLTGIATKTGWTRS